MARRTAVARHLQHGHLHLAIPEDTKSFETVNMLSIFRAKDYDATIEFYWVPLLAKSNSDDTVVHGLDDRVIRGAPMNTHSRFWKSADVLVFNSYLWWMTGEKIQILERAALLEALLPRARPGALKSK
ncbi:hypothetical protein ABZP36_003654 [Zizania latifolia]